MHKGEVILNTARAVKYKQPTEMLFEALKQVIAAASLYACVNGIIGDISCMPHFQC